MMIAFILLTWTGLFLVFSGIGLLVMRLMGRRARSAEGWLLSFWLGWAAALFALQIWNLGLKVNGWTLVLFAAIALMGLAWNGRDLVRLVRRGLSRYPWMILLLLLAGFWMANRVSGSIGPYDAGLYHLQLVKWFSTYPLIPGLGNVHGRFAFNSAYFLYAALLDIGPWWHKSHHLANALLVFVLFAQILYSFIKLFLEPGRRQPVYFFYTLFFAPLLTWVYSEYFSSISPDLPVFCLGIILAGQLLSLLLGNSENRGGFAVFTITALACAGVIVKLSFTVMGALSVLVALAVWWRRNKGQLRQQRSLAPLWVIGCAVLSLLPWMYRGVLLSGYPAYPSTLGAFAVPWRIPRYLVLNEEKWIQGWARNQDLHWGNVLYTSDWMQPWFDQLPAGITQPLTLALLAVFLTALLASLHKGPPHKNSLWPLFIPPLLSIAAWFLEAPDPRFAGASFWVLAAGLIVLVLEKARFVGENSPAAGFEKAGMPLVQLLIGLMVFLYVNPLQNPLWIAPFRSREGLVPLPLIQVSRQKTERGLQVNIPRTGEQCWAAPLPCAPVFNPGLYALQEEDLRKGFAQDFSPPPAPEGFSLSPGLSLHTIMGWNTYDSQTGLLWARTPSRLLVYTERDLPARLYLLPEQLWMDGEMSSAGELTLSLDRKTALQTPIQAGEPLDIPLHLHSGFNTLTFELSAGGAALERVDPGNPEKPQNAIGFHSFEIRADDRPEGLRPALPAVQEENPRGP